MTDFRNGSCLRNIFFSRLQFKIHSEYSFTQRMVSVKVTAPPSLPGKGKKRHERFVLVPKTTESQNWLFVMNNFIIVSAAVYFNGNITAHVNVTKIVSIDKMRTVKM